MDCIRRAQQGRNQLADCARNKIEHLSDSRSKCSSPVILLSNTDLKTYMENTEQYIVPKIIFIQHLFFKTYLRNPDEFAVLTRTNSADEMKDFNKWNS